MAGGRRTAPEARGGDAEANACRRIANFSNLPERMSELGVPAVLNGTPCGSAQLSCATPGTLVTGDVVNERPQDVVGGSAKDRMAAETARSEAEQVRRRAEEAREVRDHDRESLETVRQERERLRETAETARIASEDARLAAETARTASEEARIATDAARHAVVDAVRATADALNTSLEQMQVVEDMRRTLREIRDKNKLDSN